MENPLGQRLRELPGPLLLTGHTGFKGTWMTFLLEHLNVPVVGYSLEAEKDSLFDRAQRTGAIPEVFADIRDYEALEQFIDFHKPSTVIHMAAQPLVLKSYESPRETFDVNLMGTVNILDVAFKKDFVKAIIVVTTDKVYRNDNSGRAFVETDPLEGKDPYSASKVGAESVVAAWQHIAQVSGGPKVISVRAGNVIGGGDFAENRIIPDLIRGIQNQTKITIRNPNSTRPWQHVLDPIVGYLSITEGLLNGATIKNLNLGPTPTTISVREIVEFSTQYFPSLKEIVAYKEKTTIQYEAEQLQINSDLSTSILNWKSRWTSIEAIKITLEWWKQYLTQDSDPETMCLSNIKMYFATEDKLD